MDKNNSSIRVNLEIDFRWGEVAGTLDSALAESGIFTDIQHRYVESNSLLPFFKTLTDDELLDWFHHLFTVPCEVDCAIDLLEHGQITDIRQLQHMKQYFKATWSKKLTAFIKERIGMERAAVAEENAEFETWAKALRKGGYKVTKP